MEDYSKYLSVDNGHGILIPRNDAYILDQYGINYNDCLELKDLILLISNYLDDDYNEELEEVIDHLSEIHYYNEVNKQMLK